jgi:hypothetical protein
MACRDIRRDYVQEGENSESYMPDFAGKAMIVFSSLFGFGISGFWPNTAQIIFGNIATFCGRSCGIFVA